VSQLGVAVFEHGEECLVVVEELSLGHNFLFFLCHLHLIVGVTNNRDDHVEHCNIDENGSQNIKEAAGDGLKLCGTIAKH